MLESKMQISEMIQRMKNEKVEVKRKDYQEPFTIVDNSIIQNNEMSFAARGLYAFIKSLPKDWTLYESWLVKQSPQGKDALRTILKELEKFRFINRYTYRYKGQFVKHEMIFSVKPIPENEMIEYIKIYDDGSMEEIFCQPETGKPNMGEHIENAISEPETGKPDMATPNMENPPLQNKHIYKTHIYNNQSVSQKNSKEEKPPAKKTDGQTDEIKKLENIISKKLEIDNLKTAYPYDASLIEELKLNVIDMYFNDHIIIEGQRKSKELIRAAIMKLTFFHMQEIIDKFREISATTRIKNTKAYIQTMIYNTAIENKFSTTNAASYSLNSMVETR